MIYRHSLEQINDYFRDEGLNQTSIKVILWNSVQAWYQLSTTLQRQEETYEEKEHFIIGSGVDCKLTCTLQDFNSLYHVTQLPKKPGPKAMKAIKGLFEKLTEKYPAHSLLNLEHYRKEIWEACDTYDYYSNRRNDDWKEDNRIVSLLKENGEAYWQDLIVADGKQVLSDPQIVLIDAIVDSFKTHPHTAFLFKDGDDIDLVFQFPMYWNINQVRCKGMIDLVYINHTRKVISPVDFKTMADYVLNFNVAARKRRYDLQGSFYSHGLQFNLTQLATLIEKHLTGYKISNFAFAVESKELPGTPMIFVLDDNMMEMGKTGDKYHSGFMQGITTYKEWAKVDFDMTRRFIKTNGVVFMGIDYNYTENF